MRLGISGPLLPDLFDYTIYHSVIKTSSLKVTAQFLAENLIIGYRQSAGFAHSRPVGVFSFIDILGYFLDDFRFYSFAPQFQLSAFSGCGV